MKLNYRLMGEGERPSMANATACFFKRMLGFKPFEFADPHTGRQYAVGLLTKHRFKKMLKVAAKANPTPTQSGFEVRVSALSHKGTIAKGSNHEHGICESTHGEETAITGLLEKERGATVAALAFATKDELPKMQPCGNCRDVILQYGGRNSVMIAGNPKGGKVSLVLANQSYYFDDFKCVAPSALFSKCLASDNAFTSARLAEHQAYSMYSEQKRVYGAAIECSNGEIFRGSLRGDVAYHTGYPVEQAIAVLRNSSSGLSRLKVKQLVIVKTGAKPFVPYRDRQHFLELTALAASLNGGCHAKPIPIRLYELGGDGAVVRGWETNSSQWLPNPFSPAQLGMDEKLAAAAHKFY